MTNTTTAATCNSHVAAVVIIFTTEELYQLKGALIDLSDRIRRAADSLE